MKFGIPESATRTFGRLALKTQKHSPALLFGAGIVAGTATVVTACRATLKAQDVISEHNKLKIDVKTIQHATYTEADRRKDLGLLHVQTGAKLVKLYGPSVVLGVTSVACLTQSHRILSSRNAGLTAALTAVDKAYGEYRARVREEVGEDKEREIYYNVEKCDEDVVDSEGKVLKKKGKKLAGVGGRYQKLFDEHNQNWNPQPEYNLAFLRLVQRQATDKLRAQGHLFLNEVFDMLGMDHTGFAAQVGWMYNIGSGDDFVDFGIFKDKSMEGTWNFLAGFESAILLDFNCDAGTILDKI